MKSNTAFSNFIWRFLERWGAQGVSLILSIILARLLDPEVYGIVAIVAILSAFLEYFIDGGLNGALIQKKDADDLDFSSVFFVNMIICVVLYGFVFFFAPVFASFYDMPLLVPMVRVQGLTILVSGVKSIQIAYVSKKMQFKKFFYSTLGGTLGGAILGLFLAFKGYGAWAIIWLGVFNNTVDTIILWFTVKWRPKFIFSIQRVKSLFMFGWKLLIYNLVNKGYAELKQLLIGRIYTPTDLAFYNKGVKFPKLIHDNTDSAMGNILFPMMSNIQDSIADIKQAVRRVNTLSVYIVSPLVIGLGVCATPIVAILLTEKWLPCVPYMQVFCATYAFGGIYISNENVIKALGQGNRLLKLQFFIVAQKTIVLIIALQFGVFAVAVGALISLLISHFIICWPSKKLIDYSYFEQLKDMLPYLALSVIMGGIVYCVSFFHLSYWLTLLIQVALGMAIYIGLSVLIKPEAYRYLLGILKGYFKKREKNNDGE